MNNTLGMSHGECFRDLGAEADGFVGGQIPTLQASRQRFAFNQLRDEIVRADIVEGTDVGMAYRCDGARFLLETANEGFLADFDRYRPVKARIVARKTWPIPPCPSNASILYGPSLNPGTMGASITSAINNRQ